MTARWELAIDGIAEVCDKAGIPLTSRQRAVVSASLSVWIDNIGGDEFDVGAMQVVIDDGNKRVLMAVSQHCVTEHQLDVGMYVVFVRRIE